MPLLQIIIASTRPGRVGGPIGAWFTDVARKNGKFDVEVVDLAELNLPMMDEPNHPRLQKYTHQHTLDFSATISRGDAYVFVMPEYNYGYSAPLKNAVDYLFHEWKNKPASFVSYGGISGGLRAVQSFKPVLSAFPMRLSGHSVVIPNVRELVTDGEFHPTPLIESSATATLDELAELVELLKPLRKL